MERPTKPCYICSSNDWWQRSDGGWLCNRCHPNPNPNSNPSKEDHSSEVVALRDRVKRGNDKLITAWSEIWDIQDEQERQRGLKRWDKANLLLDALCTELMYRFNYRDCLYLDGNGHKTKPCARADGFCCFVCPSEIPYWQKEDETKEPVIPPVQTKVDNF